MEGTGAQHPAQQIRSQGPVFGPRVPDLTSAMTLELHTWLEDESDFDQRVLRCRDTTKQLLAECRKHLKQPKPVTKAELVPNWERARVFRQIGDAASDRVGVTTARDEAQQAAQEDIAPLRTTVRSPAALPAQTTTNSDPEVKTRTVVPKLGVEKTQNFGMQTRTTREAEHFIKSGDMAAFHTLFKFEMQWQW